MEACTGFQHLPVMKELVTQYWLRTICMWWVINYSVLNWAPKSISHFDVVAPCLMMSKHYASLYLSLPDEVVIQRNALQTIWVVVFLITSNLFSKYIVATKNTNVFFSNFSNQYTHYAWSAWQKTSGPSQLTTFTGHFIFLGIPGIQDQYRQPPSMVGILKVHNWRLLQDFGSFRISCIFSGNKLVHIYRVRN